MSRRLLLPLLLALAPAAVAVEWDGAPMYAGKRYVLQTDVEPTLAKDLVSLLDAHGARLREIFRRALEHDGPLRVRLFRRSEDFDRVVGRIRGGGIYTYRDKIANVRRQARAYWTRHLLLHEATHQYLALTFGGNRFSLPWWLDEGLAEYCAFHVWDGKTLRPGIPDAITLMDYPAKAKAILARPEWDLEKTLAGGLEGDRAEAWALVSHLMEGPATRRRLLKVVQTVPRKVHVEDRSKIEKTAREQLRRLVTPRLDRLGEAVREHVASRALVWRVVTIAWDRRGDVLSGRAASTALLARSEPVEAATAEISFRYRVLSGPKGWVGVAHRVGGIRAYRVVQLTTPGSLIWSELGAGGWKRLGAAGKAVARDDAWHEATFRFGTDAIEVTVDGETLPPLRRAAAEPIGTWGLYVDSAEAEFRDVTIRPLGTR